MPRVAFVGALAASFAGRVRAHLAVPCDIVLTGEAGVVSRLPEVDVLVTLVFTAAMGAAAKRLRLVQVPGLGDVAAGVSLRPASRGPTSKCGGGDFTPSPRSGEPPPCPGAPASPFGASSRT